MKVDVEHFIRQSDGFCLIGFCLIGFGLIGKTYPRLLSFVSSLTFITTRAYFHYCPRLLSLSFTLIMIYAFPSGKP